MADASEDRAGSKEREEEAPASVVTTDAPAGPSSEEEPAFLAQEGIAESTSRLPPPAISPEEKGLAALPPLEDLVKRIPAPTRELMEELFRARFVTVKRVPKSALKS